jgi:hypothetical protein
MLFAFPRGLVWAEGGAITDFPQFYESSVIKTCSESQCIIQLAPVPNNALLQATNVFCSVTTSTPQPTAFIRVSLFQGPLATAKPKESFLVDSANPTSQLNLFTLNKEIRSFFSSGTRPIFSTGTDFATQVSFYCKLSGDLVRQ